MMTPIISAARAALSGVTVDKQSVPLVDLNPGEMRFPHLTVTEPGMVRHVKSEDLTLAFTLRAVTRGSTMRQSQAVLDAALAELKGLSIDGYSLDRFNTQEPLVRVSRDGSSRALEVRVSYRARPKRRR